MQKREKYQENNIVESIDLILYRFHHDIKKMHLAQDIDDLEFIIHDWLDENILWNTKKPS